MMIMMVRSLSFFLTWCLETVIIIIMMMIMIMMMMMMMMMMMKTMTQIKYNDAFKIQTYIGLYFLYRLH